MIRPEEVIEIGTLQKPHGTEGEITLLCANNVFEMAEEPDFIVCDMEGILVPFFLESYRYKGAMSVLLKLEDVDTLESARRFQGVKVYLHRRFLPQTDEAGEMEDEFLIGFRVEEEREGCIGTVKRVDDSTANVLLVVEHNGEEVLIPLHEEFVRKVDEEAHTLYLSMPEGLLQLNQKETGK